MRLRVPQAPKRRHIFQTRLPFDPNLRNAVQFLDPRQSLAIGHIPFNKLIFLIFSDVWFNRLADLYIDCFHNNCLICYIYYVLISHLWQHSSIPLVVQISFFFLICSQLISQLVSVIYSDCFYSSLVYRISLNIHMYIWPSNCCCFFFTETTVSAQPALSVLFVCCQLSCFYEQIK